MNYSQHLLDHGYVVVPCLEEMAKSGKLQLQFRESLATSPEFINGKEMLDNEVRFVQGGFAALGHPSSYHNCCVRDVRSWAHNTVVKKVFGPMLAENDQLKFQQCNDRALYRVKSQNVGAETAHRDETPIKEANLTKVVEALPTDMICGGWINCDPTTQYFSGCPGTHKEKPNGRGFYRISEAKAKEYTFETIEIPPGQIFIFNENMIHEVKKCRGKVQHRLFMGWRLTTSGEPLIKNVEEMMKNKSVMPLKSGQRPAMYSSMHWNFLRSREKLQTWSKLLKPQCLHDRVVKGGGDAGNTYKVVLRFMPSLKAMGLDIYPEYTQDEIDLFKPSRTFTCLKPGTKEKETISFQLPFPPPVASGSSSRSRSRSPSNDDVEGDAKRVKVIDLTEDYDVAEEIESDESDDEGSCPDTCACEACDTKDPTHWAYNNKGEYVCMSLDGDFEEDEHGNYSLKTDAKEAKRRRLSIL